MATSDGRPSRSYTPGMCLATTRTVSSNTTRRGVVSATALLGALAALSTSARVAHATDPFEIQVYDGTANAPGEVGLELHTNAVIRGLRDPALNPPRPEAPPDRQVHFTFEPSIGVTDWWELGGYFQTAILPNDTLYYAGVKLRSKFVTPPRFSKHFRLGINFEVSLLPEKFDLNKWGGEIRPIIAWESDRVSIAVNPIIDGALAGPDAHEGPSFGPAAMFLYKWEHRASIGLEYYGDVGPFSKPHPGRAQEHYIFEVANVLAIPHLELNLGVGAGLTDGSNAFVAKTIVGYVWERGR